MKLLTKLPLMALLVVFSFSCSSESIYEENELLTSELIIPEPTPFELEILGLINNHRLSLGLNPLKNMGIIKSQTYSHTDYMVETQTVSHDNFYKRSNFLKKNAGAILVSENVAYGYTSALSLVNAWMKSDSHKTNIEGDFTHFDISAEKGTDNKWYYTNIFIKK